MGNINNKPIENNLQKLTKLFSLMDSDSLTKEDFLKAFKAVIEFVKRMEEKHNKTVEELKKAFSEAANQLSTGNKTDFDNADEVLKEKIEKIFGDQNLNIGTISKRVDKFKTENDEGRASIINDIVGQFPEPPEEFKLVSTEIRDLLETLKGVQRLDIKSIRGLDKKFEEITEKLNGMSTANTRVRGGVGAGKYVHVPMVKVFTGDGVTKAFLLDKAPKSLDTIDASGVDFPYIMANGAGFTVEGRTLTLDADVDAPSDGSRLVVRYYI